MTTEPSPCSLPVDDDDLVLDSVVGIVDADAGLSVGNDVHDSVAEFLCRCVHGFSPNVQSFSSISIKKKPIGNEVTVR